MTNLTVSLEEAKLLKEAGFPQDIPDEYGDEQSRWWCTWDDKEPTLLWLQSDGFNDDGTHGEGGDIKVICKSPFAEEILSKLPNTVYIKGEQACLEILSDRDFPTDEEWIVCYSYGKNCDNSCWVKSKDGLANAASKMYRYLADNKLLPPTT